MLFIYRLFQLQRIERFFCRLRYREGSFVFVLVFCLLAVVPGNGAQAEAESETQRLSQLKDRLLLVQKHAGTNRRVRPVLRQTAAALQQAERLLSEGQSHHATRVLRIAEASMLVATQQLAYERTENSGKEIQTRLQDSREKAAKARQALEYMLAQRAKQMREQP